MRVDWLSRAILTSSFQNDLDLDLFCNELVHADIAQLKTTPCFNARLGKDHQPPVGLMSIVSITAKSHAEVE